ncbi:hypothetical protein OTU49_005212, partial [Cherax quadricarinatus]
FLLLLPAVSCLQMLSPTGFCCFFLASAAAAAWCFLLLPPTSSCLLLLPPVGSCDFLPSVNASGYFSLPPSALPCVYCPSLPTSSSLALTKTHEATAAYNSLSLPKTLVQLQYVFKNAR